MKLLEAPAADATLATGRRISTADSATPEASSHALPGLARLLDIRELAEILAVSEHTVRKWCTRGPEAGLVPTMLRINGQIRFRPADVVAFIEDREIR